MTNPTSIGVAYRRVVAGTVVLCLLSTIFSATGAVPARAQANGRVVAAAQPDPDEHFLRDAVPASSALAPPDTTDDDFVLPEEKSKGQIAKEIAIWTIAAAMVAFFIVKVFIEKDKTTSSGGSNGKDVPPPQ